MNNFDRSKYDIPEFIEGIPDGFASICTFDEASKIKALTSNNKKSSKDDMEYITKEPVPKSNHNYCHLCNAKFDAYLIHIKSDLHIKNVSLNKNIIEDINNLFLRCYNEANNNMAEVSSNSSQVTLASEHEKNNNEFVGKKRKNAKKNKIEKLPERKKLKRNFI